MTENKTEIKKNPSDYKERFEFRLYVGDNIICGRYFRIINFNPNSLNSVQLKDAIETCVSLIDESLKSKTRIYSWYLAPQVFKDVDEMNSWIEKHKEDGFIKDFTHIYLRDKKCSEHTEYIYKEGKVYPFEKNIDDGEFTKSFTESDFIDYKFSFCDNGREVISRTWRGIYPKYIGRNVDLSNKTADYSDEVLSKISFEKVLPYKLNVGKKDLVSQIVKEICSACTEKNPCFLWNGDNDKVPTKENSVNLSFNPYANYKKEIKEAYKYLNSNGMGRSTEKKINR